MLADLAEIRYCAGDLGAALGVAKEANAVAKRRTNRVAECHSALVQGTILAVTGEGTEAAKLHEQSTISCAYPVRRSLNPNWLAFNSTLNDIINCVQYSLFFKPN